MRLSEYQPLALRTESAPTLIDERVSIRVLHACMGICTEVAEMIEAVEKGDEINVMEEGGDAMWYISINCDALGCNVDDLEWAHQPVHSDPLDGLVINAGRLLDHSKRNIFYGKELNEESILILLARIFKHIVEIFDEYNIDLEDALERNIDKLKVRFPQKFCNLKAIDRNLNEERKALEL